MPVNMPWDRPVEAGDAALRAEAIRTSLETHLPMNLAERVLLQELHQCIRSQIACGALPAEREAEAFVEAAVGDEVMGWLIHNTLPPNIKTQLFPNPVEVAVRAVEGFAGGRGSVDVQDSGVVAVCGMRSQFEGSFTDPLHEVPITAMAKSAPPISYPAPPAGLSEEDAHAWAEGVRRDWTSVLSTSFQQDYAFKVVTLRTVFCEDLVDAVFSPADAATGTMGEICHRSTARLRRDAQNLAAIVVDGYHVVVPATAADAATLLDNLKQDIEMMRPVCVGLLERSYPKRADAVSSPSTVKPALPAIALSPHASDSPHDAIRWRT